MRRDRSGHAILRRRMGSGILAGDRATAPQIVVCALILALSGVLLFASHVEHGGRYSDDWANAAAFRFKAGDDLGRGFEEFRDELGGRPIYSLGLATVESLWRDDFAAQLALTVTLSAIASLLFFAVLRRLGLGVEWAIVAAVLSFVYPWSDATRLWAALAPNEPCLIFYFGGFLVAAHGLRSSHPRLWHVGALLLYVLSVLTYEAAGLAILLTGVLYVALAGWRRARPRWAADVAVILPTLAVVFTLDRTARVTPGWRSVASGLYHLPGQGIRALLEALVPLSVSSGIRALIVLAFVGALVLAIRHVGPGTRRRLAPDVGLLIGSLVVLAIAWFPFLGADLPPQAPGLDNRGNIGAAFAIALLVVALARISGKAAAGVVRDARGFAVAAVITLGAIATGWVITARDHADAYDRSARGQEELLSGLTAALPAPRRGTTIYTTAAAGQSAPGIPVFSETWDLKGAVKLTWNDATLRGFPIVGEARLECAADGVVPRAPPLQATAVIEEGYGKQQGAPYGRAIVYDARSRRAHQVGSRKRCRRVVGATRPGPIVAR